MQNTTHAKLQAIDEKLKRWQARLTRAHNAIVKLNRARKRITNPKLMAAWDTYMAKKNAVHQIAAADVPAAMKANSVKPLDTEDAFNIPNELRVTADVEAMRAERRKKEAAERKAMPLTGRKAMNYLKSKSPSGKRHA